MSTKPTNRPKKQPKLNTIKSERDIDLEALAAAKEMERRLRSKCVSVQLDAGTIITAPQNRIDDIVSRCKLSI